MSNGNAINKGWWVGNSEICKNTTVPGDMRTSSGTNYKARYKGAIYMRFIRRNEDVLRKESLAKKLLCQNDKAFWKEIKLMNNSNLSLPNDGITGSNNIVNMWKSQYDDLFNCLKKDKHVNDFCKTVDYEVDMEVSHSDIIQAIVIQDIKDSKSCGVDGIYTEHLKKTLQ